MDIITMSLAALGLVYGINQRKKEVVENLFPQIAMYSLVGSLVFYFLFGPLSSGVFFGIPVMATLGLVLTQPYLYLANATYLGIIFLAAAILSNTVASREDKDYVNRAKILVLVLVVVEFFTVGFIAAILMLILCGLAYKVQQPLEQKVMYPLKYQMRTMRYKLSKIMPI